MTTRRTKPLEAYQGKEDRFQATAISLVRMILQSNGIDPRLAYHVPNEGPRTKRFGGNLKRQGLVRGVPDIQVDVARGGYHGLRLELKVWPNNTTDDQEEFHALLREQGYRVVVAYGITAVEEAMDMYFDRRRMRR